MKKRNIFFAFLLFPFTFSLSPVSAQSHIIDSLKNALKTEKENTSKVNTLNALSRELSQIGKDDTSLACANDAQTLAEKLGYKKGIANAFSNIGFVYDNQENYSEALEYYFKVLAIRQETQDKQNIPVILGKIGGVYHTQENYSQALEFFFKALAVNKENGNKISISNNFGSIGLVYSDMGKYSEAVDYFLKALVLKREIGNKSAIASVLNNIGIVYAEQGNYSKGLEYFFQSLDLSKKLKYKYTIVVNLMNIGDVYEAQGKYPEALQYFFKSLALSKELKDKPGITGNLRSIGEVYTKQKNFKQAKEYLDSVLTLLNNIDGKDEIKNTYGDLSHLDSATGNYKTAWEDYKKYIAYRDSLINETEIKKSTQALMNYEFDKKQDSVKTEQVKQDAIKETEIKDQKRILNYTLGGLALVAFFLVLVFFQRTKIAKEKKEVEKQKERSEELLLNILPSEVAEELKEKGSADAKQFDEVSVIFTDFKGFTSISEKLTAKELVAEIDYCFKGFDAIIEKYGIEKIKTIGDSYMAAGGLPVENKTHAKDVVNAAIEIIRFMENHKQQRIKENKPVFEIRIGINTGPVVAGIVGVKKFAYDIWGDTVNLASRMESSGEPGKINISGSTYELIKNDFTCTYRGKIQAKNKGEVDMYFVQTDPFGMG